MLQDLTDRLRQFGTQEDSCVLVAVSGGLDSMALAHLMLTSGAKMAVAHCNFGLRGHESDEDERFVRDWCLHHQIPFHFRRFDTAAEAITLGISIQMAARELRFAFFSELMDDHGYAFTALAHHADDRIESVVLHLLRGTGIRGFQGMPSKRGRFIRPLMGIRHMELEDYANKHGIAYRTDSSNSDTKYRRNYVRHRVLPMLRAIDMNVDMKLIRFAERAEAMIPAFEARITEISSRVCATENEMLVIDRMRLSELPYPFTFLREVLGGKGFTTGQVMELLRIGTAGSGEMESDTHHLFMEPRRLAVISKERLNTPPSYTIESVPRNLITSLRTGNDTVLCDAATVNPEKVQLRKWNAGDRFQPFGMDGRHKKLSDYLIDQQVTPLQKAMTWVLTHDDVIVWIIGQRMAHPYRVTKQTETVLRITLRP